MALAPPAVATGRVTWTVRPRTVKTLSAGGTVSRGSWAATAGGRRIDADHTTAATSATARGRDARRSGRSTGMRLRRINRLRRGGAPG